MTEPGMRASAPATHQPMRIRRHARVGGLPATSTAMYTRGSPPGFRYKTNMILPLASDRARPGCFGGGSLGLQRRGGPL